MSTINSYILRQTMRPLLATVAIALLVLLTERMLRLLDLVLDTGGGLTVLLRMLAFLVPHYMALALPAAFFLGVLLAFNRLHQNRELDALGTAGVGLHRLVLPVVALAVMLAIISAANFAIGQPYARYIYRSLVHNVTEAAANVYLQERTFVEVKGITFMAERIWKQSNEFGKIFIYQDDEGGKSTVTTAERGGLSVGSEGERSTLSLLDGVRQESRVAGRAGTDKPGNDLSVLKFTHLQVPIDLVGQAGFRPRGEDEREFTLLELWEYQNSPPAGVRSEEMLAEFHDRLVRSVSVLILPFLAVAFALGPRRSRQTFGIAVGLLILVAYNQALNTGKALASAGQVSPLVGQWLPCALLVLGSGYLFYRCAFVVPRRRWGVLAPVAALVELLQKLRLVPRTNGRRYPE